MRIAVVLAPVALVGLACTFSARPPSGVQKCSSDNPPRCPDGYACNSAGYCDKNGQVPQSGGSDGNGSGGSGSGDGGSGGSTSGSGGQSGDGGPCTPLTINCGRTAAAGKRCGTISNGCNGTVDCGQCIATEKCQPNNVCAVPCGGTGERCCANSKCTDATAICLDSSCTACGGTGQPCCANDACSAAADTCVDSYSAVLDAGAGTNKVCLPVCATTSGSCTTGTDQDCFTTCGPSKIGKETCSCQSSTWKCDACVFQATENYSCYALPTPVSLCDPNSPPTANAACSIDDCKPCGSATGKAFIDATGTARSGYCICTGGRWNCTVPKQWPCPGNNGC